MIRIMIFFIMFGLFLSPFLPLFAQQSTSCNIVMTNNQANRKTPEYFSCYDDTVYAYITLPEKIVGNNDLEGLWFKPDGQIQGTTKIPLKLENPGCKDFYLYLDFNADRPRVMDRFLLPGDKYASFAGLWKLHVLLNNEEIAVSTFSVVCN